MKTHHAAIALLVLCLASCAIDPGPAQINMDAPACAQTEVRCSV